MHTFMHTCTYAYMHTYMHIYIDAYMHTCSMLCAYIHAYMHICMHTCIYAYMPNGVFSLLMLFASTGTVVQDCPRASSDERGLEKVGGSTGNLYNFHEPSDILYETITPMKH